MPPLEIGLGLKLPERPDVHPGIWVLVHLECVGSPDFLPAVCSSKGPLPLTRKKPIIVNT